ncbi:MAG TPA: trypsin-like peptidase domain-containing protein [Candidatus Acidoferrales bacterium]|nr:trypsin-like peptidase domain-containing protein [Candidatus Acidoferrales bacterium]
MTAKREKILIIEGDASSRQSLVELLRGAGYEVLATDSPPQDLEALENSGADLLLLDANLALVDCCSLLTELRGSTLTAGIRAVLLSTGGAAERSRGLDLGADDVLTRPWDTAELLARVRAQLRTKRALDDALEKTRLAEEGQEIAHTAFQALAVTEKMTRDAFSLERMLKIGVSAALVVVAIMAVIFFLYRGRAEKESRRAYAMIAQLERGVVKQQDLVVESRRMRQEIERSSSAATPSEKAQLEKKTQELRARIVSSDVAEVAALRKQLDENTTLLRHMEDENQVAQSIIRTYTPSVCLVHVIVAFRHKQSGLRLRYAGFNPQGEPLQDSEGNPVYTLNGNGPEVRTNFFGTGFLVAADGRILTNRHVIEPWWKDEQLEAVAKEGIEAVISSIDAYFPDSPHAYRVEIKKITPDADLAIVQGDLEGLKPPVLAFDAGKGAAVSGQPIVSVGYATGLAGILARAGESTAEAIVTSSDGNPKQVLAELARRNLIRPITTQGHIGDILPDKIVYDAQTTSGGSGGPLFNHRGKVIGVTFAVVKGFSGSNFGIPAHYALPLLAHE